MPPFCLPSCHRELLTLISVDTHKLRTISLIGLAQVVASASSQYLPAVISEPGGQALGISPTTFFVGVSVALVTSALVGPTVGRMVDKFGGRPMLMLSNILYAIGLLLLSMADGITMIMVANLVLGCALACGQFEAAFATLVMLFGKNSRNAITGITLIAGFASFVGWTVSVQILELWGWQGVCRFWAGVHLLFALPLHALIPAARQSEPALDKSVQGSGSPAGAAVTEPSRRMGQDDKRPGPATPIQSNRVKGILMAYVFAANAFVGMGLMMHLPGLLQVFGVSMAAAFTIGSLVGPAQVLGRLMDFFVMRKWHPLVGTRLAALTHPVGAALMLVFGTPFATAFVVLHGTGNGVLIMSRGTLPLAIFGALGYGRMQGWLMLPAKLAQACAPFLFGMALTDWGTGTLWMTGLLGLSTFAALCLIKRSPAR